MKEIKMPDGCCRCNAAETDGHLRVRPQAVEGMFSGIVELTAPLCAACQRALEKEANENSARFLKWTWRLAALDALLLSPLFLFDFDQGSVGVMEQVLLAGSVIGGLILTPMVIIFPILAWRAMGRATQRIVHFEPGGAKFANSEYQARFEALNSADG